MIETLLLFLCAIAYASTKESYCVFFAEITNSTEYSNEATKEIKPYLVSAGIGRVLILS